ncbi:ATP cone domain-containing protein [Blastococcus brunescens]|uniref:ATP cone domain-containing protein n=1 Tax=Blastococcus brunescens TaxID=1564165 RepID=A0ABZ1B258_9ACTN|nr:ATP cone domain-containing protein [Blastococcus sp. BMG 8361]WRL64880.1 ATP cone domain-containing protein [Blastococcus sp. BMG 8361]
MTLTEQPTTAVAASQPPPPTPPARSTMHVRKRSGDLEPVDVNKIVRAVARWCDDLTWVDPLRVATRTISGLYDGATSAELDRLSIQTAAEMTGRSPSTPGSPAACWRISSARRSPARASPRSARASRSATRQG